MQNNKDIHMNIPLEDLLVNPLENLDDNILTNHNNVYLSFDKIDIDQIIRSIKIEDNFTFYDNK